MASSHKSTNLSETGFLRLNEVLKIFPISKSTWWAGIKSGRFPKPVKISQRCSAWKISDIQNLVSRYETVKEK